MMIVIRIVYLAIDIDVFRDYSWFDDIDIGEGYDLMMMMMMMMMMMLMMMMMKWYYF